MEFKDFWLKFDNNSSKELDLKSGVRRKDVSKDYHGIFDLYDSNKDGVLENKELANIFNTIKEKAGEDKVLDVEENASLSKFYSSMGLEVSMHDFVNALDEADNNIVGHEENEMADGSRQVMTSYADGTVESRTFYADGSSLTCVNDKPVQLIRQNNGKVVEELYYTYNDKTAIDNASVTIHKKSSSALGQVEIITVPNVNSDGQYDPEEITKVTKLDLVTNSYFILSKVEGKIYKEIPAVVDGSVVTIYNEYDLTNFDDYKEGESKASLQFMLDGEGNKYFVNYKDDCTIFHAKNGETIDSICKDFNIPKEDLLKLNPSLATNGNIKVGDEIKVKGTFEVNSPLLKGRNNPEGELNVYMRAFYKNKVVENISIHNKERIKLDKDYANLNDLATAILYKQGKNPKPEDVEIFAISLSVLNPELRVEDLKKNKELVSLQSTSITPECLDGLRKAGYPISEDNLDLYKRIGFLDQNLQTRIANMCADGDLTEYEKDLFYKSINGSSYETKPQSFKTDVYANIFDSGVSMFAGDNVPDSLNVGLSSSSLVVDNPQNARLRHRYNDRLEIVLPEVFNIDINSPDGKKIVERLKILTKDNPNGLVLDDPIPTSFVSYADEHWAQFYMYQMYYPSDLTPHHFENHNFKAALEKRGLSYSSLEEVLSEYDKCSDFDRFANYLLSYGYNIRTPEEYKAWAESAQCNKISKIASAICEYEQGIVNEYNMQTAEFNKQKNQAIYSVELLYNYLIQMYKGYQDQQGLLDVATWREFIGENISDLRDLEAKAKEWAWDIAPDGLKNLVPDSIKEAAKKSHDGSKNIHFSVDDKCEMLEKERDLVVQRLNSCYTDGQLAECWKDFMGTDFDPKLLEETLACVQDPQNINIAKFEKCLNRLTGDIVHNSLDAVVNDIAGKKVYAEDRTLLNAVKLDIDSIGKIDGVGDMGVMMATLGSLKAPVTGLSFSASTKTGAFVNTLLQSSTSSAAMMYTYSTVVNTVNLYTNKTKNTQQDYKLLYKTVLNDTMWGAIGGLGNGLNACVKTSYISRSANQLAKKFYTPPSNFLLKAQRVGAGLGLATELGTDVLATYAINGDMSSLEFAQSLMTTLAGGAAVDDCFAKNIDMTTKRTFQMATFEQVSNKSYDEKIKYFTGYFESQGIPKDLATLMGTITTEKNFAKGLDNVDYTEVKNSLTDVTIKDPHDNPVMKTPQESEVKVPVEGDGLKTPNRGEALIEMNNNLPKNERFGEESLDILIHKNVDPELVMDLLNAGYSKGAIISSAVTNTLPLIEKMKTRSFDIDAQKAILNQVTQENTALAELLCSDSRLKQDEIITLLRYRDDSIVPFVKKICSDENLIYSQFKDILYAVTKDNLPFAEKLYSIDGFPTYQISKLLEVVNGDNLKFAMDLYNKCGLIDNGLDLIKLAKQLNDGVDDLSIFEKIKLNEKLSALSPKVVEIFKSNGIDVDEIALRINESLNIKYDVVSVPKTQQHKFVQNILANNNPKADEVLKTFDFEQYGKDGLPLKYSREQFTANVNDLIKNLAPEEQNQILRHFGLIKGEAGFDGLPNNKEFNATDASPEVKNVADKVKQEIENFTMNNKVNTGDAEVDEVLNGLIQGFPEFTFIIGKKQHETHNYSVDIHTLKVLQDAMNNPLYKDLPDNDKTILKFSILCHDIAKKGGVRDEGHQNSSAQYCRGILEKFPFPRNMQSRIIDIVDNHHWFESYNKGIATAESVAIRCRRPEDFKIYEIMAKADLENINETFQYRVTVDKNMYDSYMSEKFNAIDNVLNKMYANANLVFDTQFMRGGDLFPTEKVMIDGVETELKVLNFNDLDSGADLQQFGFSKGVTKEDARFTVHMTDPSEAKFETVMHLTGNPSNNSVWSTSLIKDSDNITYVNRKFGFIFEVDQANISTAENHNISSGTEKGLKAFEIQMFKGPLDGDGPSTYVADKLYQELSIKGIDLTEAEYSQLVRQINRKKYTTQITKDIVVGDKTIKAADLVDALEKSRDALFLDGKRGPIHSEIVSINPIVKGMIAKVSGIEQCPPEFLRFAAKHNLPIILMTATDSF